MWRILFFDSQKVMIIANTPGHVEYAQHCYRASTPQVSIILIDARKGVIEQTYRHFSSIIY
jgi:sulfate adenylyltransferase subunit 1